MIMHTMSWRRLRLGFPALLILLFLQACSTAGPGLFSKKSPREVYGQKLTDAGLNKTALGSLWFRAADESLLLPLTISLPYKETGYFPAEQPKAAGLRFHSKKGEKINIEWQKNPVNGFLLYLELWQIDRRTNKPHLIEAADTSSTQLQYECAEDADFILRIQPELLKSGNYTVTITTGPSLAFPVSGKYKTNIGSFWGAGRDNGARNHEGIDIFGQFRTPVIAAADGVITRVEETRLGGKVVWLRPEGKDYVLYYAHLDSQIARVGQVMKTGEVVGLMGNTGNARTTPTHLHFGIYAIGGAVDPLPFVNPAVKQPALITAPVNPLGKLVRTASSIKLFAELAALKVLMTLEPHTPVFVQAASSNLYKVSLPDGEQGFISSNGVEPIEESIRKITIRNPAPIYDMPDSLAPVKLLAASKSALSMLGEFKDFYLVRSGEQQGWILKKEI
jgi:murein DD-endopeptidase MepM/ murein hydrolase activator NlpD